MQQQSLLILLVPFARQLVGWVLCELEEVYLFPQLPLAHPDHYLGHLLRSQEVSDCVYRVIQLAVFLLQHVLRSLHLRRQLDQVVLAGHDLGLDLPQLVDHALDFGHNGVALGEELISLDLILVVLFDKQVGVLCGRPDQVAVHGGEGQVGDLLEAFLDFVDTLLAGGPHPEPDAVEDDIDFLLGIFLPILPEDPLQPLLQLGQLCEPSDRLVLPRKLVNLSFNLFDLPVRLTQVLLQFLVLPLHQFDVQLLAIPALLGGQPVALSLAHRAQGHSVFDFAAEGVAVDDILLELLDVLVFRKEPVLFAVVFGHVRLHVGDEGGRNGHAGLASLAEILVVGVREEQIYLVVEEIIHVQNYFQIIATCRPSITLTQFSISPIKLLLNIPRKPHLPLPPLSTSIQP